MNFVAKLHFAESGETLAKSKNPIAPEGDRASTAEAHSFMPKGADVEVLGRSELMRFLSRTYQELSVVLDPNTKCLWCYQRPKGPPSFTPSIIRELIVLHRSIQALAASQGPDEEPLVRYYVQASQIPGIYNMGGDLSFLADKSAIMIGKQSAATPTVAWTPFIISRSVSIPALFR